MHYNLSYFYFYAISLNVTVSNDIFLKYLEII